MPAYSPFLLFAVALGGALGSLLRYLVALSLLASFPLGTLTVNVAGCTLMGVLSTFFAHRWPEFQELRLFLTVGFLGGFTTFSSFALDIGQLSEQGQYGAAFFYAFGSITLSLLGFFLAQIFMKMMLA